jgi:hypothetical protein
MRWIKLTMLSLLMLLAVSQLGFLRCAITSGPPPSDKMKAMNGAAAADWRLYDPNPNHLWNRLYKTLYQRVAPDGKDYGYDEIDPLLWYGTRYLLTNPAYQQASSILDEFASTHGEKLIKDPTKRAMLQRDLWAIFDWTAEVQVESQEKTNLQIKLARVIRSLALSPDEIARLPDSYDQATHAKVFAAGYDPNQPVQTFLPPDLFDPKGPWVQLSSGGSDPAAIGHVTGFSGRSNFLVFIRLPDGRDATLRYLQTIAAFPRPWVRDSSNPGRQMPNLDLPQFPVGTQLALVRKIVLIDNQGSLRPTNIIETVQIRVHRNIPPTNEKIFNNDRTSARTALDVFEFKLSRPKLFANENGGLSSVAAGEKQFTFFRSHGIDFEQHDALRDCANCHYPPGVHALLTRRREGILPSINPNDEGDRLLRWKSRQRDWGLLVALWQSQPGH